jgi:hypothetical protein
MGIAKGFLPIWTYTENIDLNFKHGIYMEYMSYYYIYNVYITWQVWVVLFFLLLVYVRCKSFEHNNQIINSIVSIILIFIKLEENILFRILQVYISWIMFLIQRVEVKIDRSEISIIWNNRTIRTWYLLQCCKYTVGIYYKMGS